MNELSFAKEPSLRKRFRYRKVTPAMKEEMKLLRKHGKLRKEVAQQFGVSETTVYYHLHPKSAEKTRIRERKKSKIRSRKLKLWKRPDVKKRMKEYMHQRYHEDPIFRAKMIHANCKGGKFKDE